MKLNLPYHGFSSCKDILEFGYILNASPATPAKENMETKGKKEFQSRNY